MLRYLRLFLVEPVRFQFWGSLAIVALVSSVLVARITDRRGFADGELHRDVMKGWVAPIHQPMPSVRYVPTGTVFNALEPLPPDLIGGRSRPGRYAPAVPRRWAWRARQGGPCTNSQPHLDSRYETGAAGDPEDRPPRVLLAWEPGTATNPEIVREEIDEGKSDEEGGGATPVEAAGAGPGGGARSAGAGGSLAQILRATLVGLMAGCRSLWEAEQLTFAAAYALFFVLVAYLAAYLHFYAAFALALSVTGGLLCGYAALLLPRGAWKAVAGLVLGGLAVPTLAVILQGHTGLIYTLEALALVAALMVASARPEGQHVLASLGLVAEPKGAGHLPGRGAGARDREGGGGAVRGLDHLDHRGGGDDLRAGGVAAATGSMCLLPVRPVFPSFRRITSVRCTGLIACKANRGGCILAHPESRP